MTTTDAVVGTVGGLLALGIMTNVAGKMIKGPKPIRQKQKGFNKIKSNKKIW